MAFRKTYRYFILQRQKSGIKKRMKSYNSKMKPLIAGLQRESIKLKKVNKELKTL